MRLMMHRIIAAALVAAATPLAASAQTCPTHADLTGGVRLTRFEPLFSIVQTQTPTGLTEARVMARNAHPEAVSSRFIHPVLVSERVSRTGTLTLTYENDPAGIDRINRTNTWTTIATLGADGRTIDSGQLFIRYLGTETLTIGNCSYDVWILQEELNLSQREPIASQKFYAPSLGLVLGTIQLNPDGTARSGVFFDEITAE